MTEPVKERVNERVLFRIFIMPCCGQMLCWVNPRLPSHCPECGELVYMKLKTGEHTVANDDAAMLRYMPPSV